MAYILDFGLSKALDATEPSQDGTMITSTTERILGTPPAHADDTFVVFEAGPVRLQLHAHVKPTPGDPPNEDHVAFGVDDLEEACRQLAETVSRRERRPQDRDRAGTQPKSRPDRWSKSIAS